MSAAENEKIELPEDLSSLEYVEVQALYARLVDEVRDINRQLDEAKQHLARTGVYADGDWYRRANHALTAKRKQLRAVQFEFTRRKHDKSHPSPKTDLSMVVVEVPLEAEAIQAVLDEKQGWFLVGVLNGPRSGFFIWRK